MRQPNEPSTSSNATRRDFLRQSTAIAAACPLAGASAADGAQPAKPERKIKLGLIGCGGRGPWLCELFKRHGGYQFHAVADYFPEMADRVGDHLGVDKKRRFSRLSAYKRLLESGVEAVVVANVPRFHPEHGRAAIEAGCHVYAAKPVAVDVPGALTVQAAGKLATQKKLCYLVDYQLPTDPINIEVVKRIHEGGVGQLAHIDSVGISPPWGEPPVKTIEDRLRRGRWLTTIALSGDVITENTVHSINAVLWVAGRRPQSAVARSRLLSAESARRPIARFTWSPMRFDDGLLWTHRCQSLRNQLEWALNLTAYGETATAVVSYRGKSYLRGGPKHFGGGQIQSLYDQGAIRNIATFYQNIIEGRFDNPHRAACRGRRADRRPRS